MKTLEIQGRLAALGFDPGPIDGVSGRRTIAAIKAFQAKAGLEADGIVGPKTLVALLEDAGDPGKPFDVSSLPLPWYEEAQRLMGTKEGAGSRDNKEILDWADDLDIHFPHDSIPWCGLFTAHCIGSQLTAEVLPENPLGARNWRRFGVKCDPQLGAVMVFWRTHKTQSFNGHVGFYAGEDSGAYLILGGNQSDSVSLARLAKNRFLAARWPATAPFLATGTVTADGGGGLSTDEA